jgi:hypothetical protein
MLTATWACLNWKRKFSGESPTHSGNAMAIGGRGAAKYGSADLLRRVDLPLTIESHAESCRRAKRDEKDKAGKDKAGTRLAFPSVGAMLRRLEVMPVKKMKRFLRAILHIVLTLPGASS